MAGKEAKGCSLNCEEAHRKGIRLCPTQLSFSLTIGDVTTTSPFCCSSLTNTSFTALRESRLSLKMWQRFSAFHALSLLLS